MRRSAMGHLHCSKITHTTVSVAFVRRTGGLTLGNGDEVGELKARLAYGGGQANQRANGDKRGSEMHVDFWLARIYFKRVTEQGKQSECRAGRGYWQNIKLA